MPAPQANRPWLSALAGLRWLSRAGVEHVQRTDRGIPQILDHVGVDQRGFDPGMSEKLLDSTDTHGALLFIGFWPVIGHIAASLAPFSRLCRGDITRLFADIATKQAIG